MGASCLGKVCVDNPAKGAALRVCVWVRLVGLEDHQAYDGRRWRGFVGLIHVAENLATWNLVVSEEGERKNWAT